MISEDSVFLMEAAHNQFTRYSSPIRLKEPLAPSVAAEMENTEVDLDLVFFAYRELMRHYDTLCVEGVGGLLVPLKADYMVTDLIRDLHMPIIIVGRIGLGTINHTLLTVEAARARGFTVAGIILNGLRPEKASLADLTNPRVIEKKSGVRLLGVLPHIHGLDVASCRFGSLRQDFEKNINIDLLFN